MRAVFLAVCLFVASCATRPPVPAPAPPPVPVAPVVTPAPPPATPEVHALHAVASMPHLIAEPRIRIGLFTDQTTATFPRSPSGYYIVPKDGGTFMLGRGFTVRAPKTASVVEFAVQVAALSDQTSASALASRAHADSGIDTDVVFDAATGLYRVLAGHASDDATAESLKQRLLALGYDRRMFVVRRPTDTGFSRIVSMTDDEGDQHVFNAGSILVVPAGGEPIEIGGHAYRGGALVFVNDRGLLNVINELGLENYLRGVVPEEMGPGVYDQIEALKAQAIAARTYAVKRRGDFAREGYDLCATPVCQVYGGMESEQPLTDRAVAETAGLIITWQGKPIDALFTSTCGGATSDVSTMFPERHEPYLRGVSCVDLDLARLDGRANGPALTDTGLRGALFRAAAGLSGGTGRWDPREVVRSVAAAARLAGIAVPSTRPPFSVRRRDVIKYLGAALGFDRAAAALLLPEDREYFFGSDAPAAASFMAKYQLLPAQFSDVEDLAGVMGRDELGSILYSWLVQRKAIRESTGKVASVQDRVIGLAHRGKTTTFALPAGIPLFRQLNDRYREYASLPLMISDRGRIVRDGAGRVVGAVFEANYDGAAFDRTSSYSSWVRSYRADELVDSISRRNPVKSIEDLRPLSTDDAHRVKRLMVVADGGRTFVLKGITIRWSLNLPDNLFVMSRSVDPDGTPRFTFYGKGWGHGTGMCQIGAYGMAFRGATAEQILTHYYTGVKIEKMK